MKDDSGMGLAVVLLQKTLEPGMYRPNIQSHTARRLRSGYYNTWGASKHTLTSGVMARDKMKTFVTKYSTLSL